MKENFRLLILFAAASVLSSCATILNSPEVQMKFLTTDSTRLVVGADTLKELSVSKRYDAVRGTSPLFVTVFNDSVSKRVTIESKNSVAYWLNAYPTIMFWTGFYIDTKTKKRYTYPKTIYIDMNSADSSYLTYKPLKDSVRYSNIVKVNPARLFGFYNSGIEISYERRTGKAFSTQITTSYLITGLLDRSQPDVKGIRFALKEKFYYRRSAPAGPYASLEFDYMNRSSTDVARFGKKDSYTDTADLYKGYLDTFRVHKQTYGLNFKIGYQEVWRRFTLDLYMGIGLKYRDVSHAGRSNPKDEMNRPRHPNIDYSMNVEGRYLTLSVPLGFRIGYCF